MKEKEKTLNEIEKFVKGHFNDIVKILDYHNLMVVRKVDVKKAIGVKGCPYCKANLDFAKKHKMKVLERVDSFDVVGVCIDTKGDEKNDNKS